MSLRWQRFVLGTGWDGRSWESGVGAWARVAGFEAHIAGRVQKQQDQLNSLTELATCLHGSEVVHLAFRLLGYDPDAEISRPQFVAFVKSKYRQAFSYVSSLHPEIDHAAFNKMLQNLQGSHLERRHTVAHHVSLTQAHSCAENTPELAKWIQVLTSDMDEASTSQDHVSRRLELSGADPFLVEPAKFNTFSAHKVSGEDIRSALQQARPDVRKDIRSLLLDSWADGKFDGSLFVVWVEWMSTMGVTRFIAFVCYHGVGR